MDCQDSAKVTQRNPVLKNQKKGLKEMLGSGVPNSLNGHNHTSNFCAFNTYIQIDSKSYYIFINIGEAWLLSKALSFLSTFRLYILQLLKYKYQKENMENFYTNDQHPHTNTGGFVISIASFNEGGSFKLVCIFAVS